MVQDIIKVNGWQVSPAELEAIILQHPAVLDVAVVGVSRVNDDGIEETRPRAFVVPRSESKSTSLTYVSPPCSPELPAGYHISEAEIQDYVAAEVITYKRLTGGVIFVDQIPRSPTGKILRRLLDTSAASQANPGRWHPTLPVLTVTNTASLNNIEQGVNAPLPSPISSRASSP